MPDISTIPEEIARLWSLFQAMLTVGLCAGLITIPLSLGLNELWKWTFKTR